MAAKARRRLRRKELKAKSRKKPSGENQQPSSRSSWGVFLLVVFLESLQSKQFLEGLGRGLFLLLICLECFCLLGGWAYIEVVGILEEVVRMVLGYMSFWLVGVEGGVILIFVILLLHCPSSSPTRKPGGTEAEVPSEALQGQEVHGPKKMKNTGRHPQLGPTTRVSGRVFGDSLPTDAPKHFYLDCSETTRCQKPNLQALKLVVSVVLDHIVPGYQRNHLGFFVGGASKVF